MKKEKNLLSEFKMEGFSILESHFKVVPVQVDGELPELQIDVDFQTYTSDSNMLRIIVAVDANKDAKVPGYVFSVVGEGIFSFPEDLSEKNRSGYTSYSALPLIINSIRAYIMNISAYSFFGQYTLPLIDINKIIEKKLANKSKKQKK